MENEDIVSGALSRGYSIDEIADKLSVDQGLDPAEIRARGYNSNEILGKLGYQVPRPAKKEEGFFDSAVSAIKNTFSTPDQNKSVMDSLDQGGPGKLGMLSPEYVEKVRALPIDKQIELGKTDPQAAKVAADTQDLMKSTKEKPMSRKVLFGRVDNAFTDKHLQDVNYQPYDGSGIKPLPKPEEDANTDAMGNQYGSSTIPSEDAPYILTKEDSDYLKSLPYTIDESNKRDDLSLPTRALGTGAHEMAFLANMLGGFMVQATKEGINAAGGNLDESNWLWDQAGVNERSIENLSLGSSATTAQKIGFGVVKFLPDLALMAATGGASAELQAEKVGLEAVAQQLKHGASQMRGLAIKNATLEAKNVLDHGGSQADAVKAATMSALFDLGTGGVAMGSEGNVAKRFVTGVPVGAAIGAGRISAMNSVLPANQQQEYDPSELLVGGITQGILHGVMGGKARDRMPTREELGYAEGRKAEANLPDSASPLAKLKAATDESHLSELQAAKQQTINNVKSEMAVAKISQATSVDEAIASANEAINTIPVRLPVSQELADGSNVILQNRDRRGAGSVEQMSSIAAAPDYGRLSVSRDFTNGAPVVFADSALPETAVIGKESYATTADGRRIPVKYAAVEASSLLASNGADGTPNLDYVGNADGKLRAIAGNGRIAGLQEAYARGTSEAYRNELMADGDHGIDPAAIAQMKEPVLVRVMPKNEVTADIGDVSNTTGTAALSPIEQAANDARRVDVSALQFDDNGLSRESVQQFVNSMPMAERAGLMNPDGTVTRQAEDRLMAAVFHEAYGNEELVKLYAQAVDPESKTVLNALAIAAPKLVQLKNAGEFDIRDVISEAAQISVNAKRNGVKLVDWIQNADFTRNPETVAIVRFMAENSRSAKRIGEGISDLADAMLAAHTSKSMGSMFDDLASVSRGDVLKQFEGKYVKSENQTDPIDAGRSINDVVNPEQTAVERTSEVSSDANEVARQESGNKARSTAEIISEINKIDAAVKERTKDAKLDFVDDPDIKLLTPEERNRLHELKLELPMQGELAEEARQRIKERIQNRQANKQKFALESETADQARARITEQEQQARAVADEQSRLETQDKQDHTDREIAARQESSAENFELGQSTEDSLSGQQDIFKSIAEPQAFESKTAANYFKVKNGINGIPKQTELGWQFDPSRELTESDKRESVIATKALNAALAEGDDPARPLLKAPNQNFALARELGKLFGFKVHFIDQNGTFDGVAHNGNAFLSSSMKHPVIAIVGHEMLHLMEKANRALSNKFRTAVAQYLKDGVIDARQLREGDLAGRDVSRSEAAGETFADINGAMFLDPKFWRELRDADRNLFRQAAYTLMEVLSKANKVLTGSRFDVSEFVTDVDAVRKILVDTWTEHNQTKDLESLTADKGAEFSRKDKFEKVKDAWKSIGESGETFRYPKSKSTDWHDLMSEFGLGKYHIEEETFGKNHDPRWIISAPKENWKDTVPVIVSANPREKSVWINTAFMKEGDNIGARVYQMVSDWAKNNGYMFIGDPDGLSVTAMRRRTEQMLASALKHGTTDHLMPHDRQVNISAEDQRKTGIRPLDWSPFDTDHNIKEMLQTVHENLLNVMPEARDLSYNEETGKYYLGDKEYDNDAFFKLSQSAEARKANAGVTTLKRAAITNSILSEKMGTYRGSDIRDNGDVRERGSDNITRDPRNRGIGEVSYSRKDGSTEDMFPVPDEERANLLQRARSGQDSLGARAAIIRADSSSLPGEYGTVVKNRPSKTVKSGVDKVESPADVAHITQSLSELAREHLDVVVLGDDGKVLAVQRMFSGGKTSASIPIEEIIPFVNSIDGAKSFYASHNHPGESSELSDADLRLTREVHRQSSGVGPKFEGLMAVAGSEYEFTNDGYSRDSGDIPNQDRTKKITYVEQVIEKNGGIAPKFNSPQTARLSVLEASKGKTGIVFTNSKLLPVAFFPLDFSQTGKLHGKQTSRDVMAAVARSNAVGAIFHYRSDNDIANLKNVGTLLGRANVNVMDAFNEKSLYSKDERSLSEIGETIKNKGDVLFSRNETSNKSDLVDETNKPEPVKSPESLKEKLSSILKVPAKIFKSTIDEPMKLIAPMSTGSDDAKVIATKFSYAEQRARYQWNRFDEIITKEFSKEQQEKMWNAADQENNLRREGRTSDTEGLNSLEPREREVVEFLHDYSEMLWDKAVKNGMVDSDGVHYWTPRKIMLIDDNGRLSPLKKQEAREFSKDARNLRTSASSMKSRKYETTEEAEAAAQAYAEDGKKAVVVRNIRTMPMAMAELERAIAGRELVNQIKAMGEISGRELVAEGMAGNPEFFTMDHPALRKAKPVFIEDPETGKMRAKLDEDGMPVMERTPIFISKEFEGPIKAVLHTQTGEIYNTLMELKSKSMGVIMMSPAIHFAVEWGRSFPAMLSSVSAADAAKNAVSLGAYTYFVGYKAKQNDALMRDFISHGLVPLGNRGMNADIHGIADGSTMEVGRSWTAKGLGKIADVISPKAGDAVRGAVDKAGDFWHGTLLWNRIADLQVGLAVTMKTSLINKGIDEYTATTLAAQWANRYAGALPPEAMGQAARQVANLAMFSRSFTLGNLGLMKDMVNGLPPNRQAMIKMAAREAARALEKSDAEIDQIGDKTLRDAKRVARTKAIQSVALDIALMYLVNAAAQAYFENEEQKKDWKYQVDKFGERWSDLKKKALEDPVSVMMHPFHSLESLTPQGHNMEGKRERIRVGDDKDGNTIYMRLPFGKVGEELLAYTSPNEASKLMANKRSPMLSGAFESLSNQDHWGHKVYNENDGVMKQVGKAAWHFMKAQTPWDQLVAMKEVASGHGDEMDYKKSFGPFAGLTYSKVTGGDVLAQEYKAQRDFQDRKVAAMPDARHALKEGNDDEAWKILEDTGMTPKEIGQTIVKIKNPGRPMPANAFKKVYQHATDEQKAVIDELRGR